MKKLKQWLRLPLWVIIAVACGALILGGIIFSRDYRRERELLSNIFLQRGELLIHSLEMVGRMRSGDNLADNLGLFWNNLEDSDNVLFLALTDAEGRPLAVAGELAPGAEVFQNPQEKRREALLQRRLERVDGQLVYLIYRPFKPQPRPRRGHSMMTGMGEGGWMDGRHHMMGMREEGRNFQGQTALPPAELRYAWVGFNLAPFEAASQERVRTAALFVLLFSLAALGGVLALFWAHNSRLNRRMYEESQAELLQKRRLATLGSLAAGLAHEIRNPLGAIRGLSQHLLTKAEPADRETLDVMLASVDRLNATITDFLDYARPTEIKPQPMDVTELLRKLAALAAHDARSQGVEVSMSLPPAPLMISGDESQLAQAFLNIYLNAIQAAGEGEGGRLAVALKEAGGRARITFHDNGPGFSPEQLAQAFIPYFTTKAEGTGLGLALVEKSVRAHEGADISLETPPEGGALVTVTFPIVKTEDKQ